MIDMTVSEAKEILSNELDKGTYCIVCSQHAQRYWRVIYGYQAYLMIMLYRLTVDQPSKQWFHVTEIHRTKGFSDGSFAKLRYWGLVQGKTKDPNEDKRTSGYWQITDRGVRYVLRKVRLKKYAVTYNERCEKYDGPYVGIEESLGKKFSYTELMMGYR
jgi:hypothetical protein